MGLISSSPAVSQSLSGTSSSTVRQKFGALSAATPLIAVIVILLLQTLLSMSLQNSAFQDEALYVYAGREYFEEFFLGGEHVIEPYGLYFSGLPTFYPLIAGALDVVAGIEGARFFSLLCMLTVTVCAYVVTRRLFDVNSALCAAAIYAVQGSVLFLSRLATYDAMCLALAAMATVFALSASEKRGLGFTILTGLALFGAVAAKYAGLMFVPTVLAILAWRTFQSLGIAHAVIKSVIVVAIVGGLIAALLLLDPQILVGVNQTTTNRQALLTSPRLDLALRSLELTGLLTLVAAVGLFAGRFSWKMFPLKFIFFATIFIAPAYHIYKMESFSLHKHVAYGLFFGAPLAGFALARWGGYIRERNVGSRWIIALAVILLAFGVGFTQARGFYTEWSDSDALIRLMRTQVRPGVGRYLAEESEVMRYYLQDVVDGWQWNQLYWFYYTARDGTQLQGIPAYHAAIEDGYFDLIVLRYGPAVTTALAIDDRLHGGTNYDLIAQIPYFTMFGEGDYWVWRRAENVQFSGRPQGEVEAEETNGSAG